jgi:hypothetical protein
MMEEIIEDRNNILSLQKGIMNSILDYQIRYGADSVSWNVTISFMEKRK